MKNFRSWLRLPWPITTLDREDNPNFKKSRAIFAFLQIFGTKNRFFCPMRRATWRSLFLGASKSQKLTILGFFMEKCVFLPVAKKFGQLLSPQNFQKHSKNDLTAPILTNMKQCWED